MANIKFLLKGRGNLRTIHVRFYKGRQIDFQTSTGILIDPKKWDPYPGMYRTGLNYPDGLKNQNRINKLAAAIIEAYNTAYIDGNAQNPAWFDQAVAVFSNQQVSGSQTPRDLISFMAWWIENKSLTWRVGRGRTMGDRAKKQYENAIAVWKEFEGKSRKMIADVGNSLLSQFADFLYVDKKYSGSTAKRTIGRVKFFLARAEMEGLEVKTDYKERIYTGTSQDPLKPYLNEDEIADVFSLDLDHDQKLDNIRDCFIIGLWTGLRISDFNHNLDTSNIDTNSISIRTQKTGAWVTIPLHPMVRYVLKKRHGFLPRRYNDAYFNESIKTICMLAEIDKKIPGKKYCPELNRHLFNIYKKWELITSHTCRRSFCSNLYGKVPNYVLADLGGWSNEKTMVNYVKRTKAESAEVLKKVWEI